jgi:hypothetical protein
MLWIETYVHENHPSASLWLDPEQVELRKAFLIQDDNVSIQREQ